MTQVARYKTYARRETHPARLGALGRMYGIESAAIEQCAVCEFGCGDGGNIIPLAARYPLSRFVGIDISEELIEKGRRDIESLGLHNIDLRCGDIATVSSVPEKFDYVICHGVYSWVSPEVQRAILRAASEALNDNGLFVCSYNTFPGWRQRGVVRDILRVGAARCAETASDIDRYNAALNLLSLVAHERGGPGDLLGQYLRESLERLQSSEPGYVIQEFLGPHNTPLLFRDFMAAAERERLQFLSEARVVMMSADDLSDDAKAYLAALGDDVIAREQALDLIRNRMFRETILCHQARSLTRGLKTEAFKRLYFVANYISSGDNASGTAFRERTTFREVQTPPGECSMMLGVVASLGARGGTFHEILDASRVMSVTSEREALSIIATLWTSGFIDALTTPLVEDREYVRASPWARLQAERCEKVTSALHDSYDLSPLERTAILRADDRMTREALSTMLLGNAPRAEVAAALDKLFDRGLLE